MHGPRGAELQALDLPLAGPIHAVVTVTYGCHGDALNLEDSSKVSNEGEVCLVSFSPFSQRL